MSSYITMYKGKPLYLVTYHDFIELYKKEALENNAMYIISDKKNALIDDKGLVIGYIFDNYRKIMPISGTKKSWKEMFGYKEEIVISERPTIEGLKTESNKKLEQIAAKAVVVVEKLL